ncbi:MAG: alanine racemase [Actinomycetota bacterium]|nr:alanine racemase [Actinomycetota bacterium]
MTSLRPTWVDVDLDAISHNVRALSFEGTEVMAVVKADAYGHGSAAVARAALDAGATWLGVALVEEGLSLRAAGIEAPVLVLSECPPGAEVAAVSAGLTLTLCSEEGLKRLAAVAPTMRAPIDVHVKADTGMHRIGVWPPHAVVPFVGRVTAAGLGLGGLWTHLACADSDEVTTRRQLDMFRQTVDQVRRAGDAPRLVHAANTAGAIGFPDARFDLVRTGIGIYGVEPAPGIGAELDLRPALTWRSAVSFVKRLTAGTRISYGHHGELARDAWVATVPVGYADGYPRMLSTRADVVIGGRRCRVAGSVTMDQVIVDCGDVEPVPGDEVVLLGAQGPEIVTAWELAAHAGSIAYEVMARIGARVPRRHHSGQGSGPGADQGADQGAGKPS